MAPIGARLWAPVAAPPPPKPPQLNIVASSLMPDVSTDTLGPGAGPSLAAAGWAARRTDDGQVGWDRPPGDTLYAEAAERHNSLVAAVGAMDDPAYKRYMRTNEARLRLLRTALEAAADGDERTAVALTAAVGVMDDLELQQVEQAAGVSVDSLPTSLFPASRSTRWTGGFAYAPENQYAGVLADPCGQSVDLPGGAVPLNVAATPSNLGGTLTNAGSPYQYEITGTNANGESLPSAAVNATIASGTTGSVTITWRLNGSFTGYKVYGRKSGSLGLIATVSGSTASYTDTGSPAPGAVPPVTDTTGGPGSYGNLPQVYYVPFLIQVEDECSAFGWEARDFTGRALRLLDNATPNAIEREFWTGTFAQNTLTGPFNGTNAFLQQSSTPANGGTGIVATDLTPGGGPASITRGIQILEDYLANTGFGGQGMIHVAPETAPNLLGARRVGSLLLSVMDNIVVPGSGYPTTGSTGPAGNANANPGAGNAWIFCSDLVSVRLDDPEFWPTTMAEATDRGSFGQPNTVRIRAQRFAAATFDVARLAACRVTLTT